MVRMDESLSQSQAVWASHDEPLPELSGRSVNNLTTEEHHILEGNTTPVLPSASASPSPPASIISREDKDVTDSYTSVWGSLTRLVGKSKPVPTTAEKAEDWTDLGESSGDSASIRTIRPKKKGSSGAEARNQELPHKQSSGWIRVKDSEQIAAQLEWTPAAMESGDDFEGDKWQQAGQNADAQDLAGPGMYGRLECSVGKPQKEGEGTQNAYISYLVTTDVRSRLIYACAQTLTLHRPTSSPSNRPTLAYVAASQTLSSSTRPSVENIHNAQCPLCPTSTRWNTYEATGSDQTSPLDVHTPSRGSSSV